MGLPRLAGSVVTPVLEQRFPLPAPSDAGEPSRERDVLLWLAAQRETTIDTVHAELDHVF